MVRIPSVSTWDNFWEPSGKVRHVVRVPECFTPDNFREPSRKVRHVVRFPECSYLGQVSAAVGKRWPRGDNLRGKCVKPKREHMSKFPECQHLGEYSVTVAKTVMENFP